MKKSHYCLLTSVLALCLIILNGKLFAENVEPSKLVDLVKNKAHEIKTLRWKCNIKHYRIEENGKKKLPYEENVEVCYDLAKKTYHVKKTGNVLSQDAQGSEQEVQYTSEFSYDGKVYREWRTAGVGNDDTQNAQGVVSEEINDCVINREFLENRFASIGMISGVPGVIYVGPNLTSGGLFADYLSEKHKEKKISHCETMENNLLKISVQDKLDMPGVQSPIVVEILYNPSTCIIEEIESRYDKSNPIIKYTEISGKYTEHEKMTVPEQIVFKQIARKVTMQSEYNFEDFVINPVMNDQEYEIVFPDGTDVNDYIAKKYYKVGDVIEEDRAISEFMQRRAMTGDMPNNIKRNDIVRYALIRYTLIGIGVVIFLLALWQILQKRKRT